MFQPWVSGRLLSKPFHSQKDDEVLQKKPRDQIPPGFFRKNLPHLESKWRRAETNGSGYPGFIPKASGNHRNIIVSNQAGRSNIISRLENYGIKIDSKDIKVQKN